MNDTNSKINFFSNITNFIKENLKIIFLFILLIIIFIVSFQIYFYYQNKAVLELSISYNDVKKSSSKIDFIEQMTEIAESKSFYGMLASLELINAKINDQRFDESYEEYLELLNNNKTDKLYLTLLAVHGSYNLFDKISSRKIENLLSYIDDSFDSFIGYHLEILYLLSLTDGNKEKSKSLYKQIIENDKISLAIKERVKKINEFEKYN